MVVALLAVISLLSPALPAIAQERTTPPPLSTIKGRVTDAATGRPIRMARIALAATERRQQSAERFTRTAPDGSYELRDVVDGRFTLTVSKARYVTLQYGQVLPAPEGRTLEIGGGRVLDRIDVALSPAAAITGRITDEYGEPLERGYVSAMRMGYTERGRSLVSAGSAVTNDAGEYRIPHLQPGEYYVIAAERSESFGSEPDADIGFLKTAYPSAANLDSARPVTVRGGQDAVRIDIAMLPAPAVTIAGRVVTANGLAAAGVMLVLQSVGEGPGLGPGSATQSATDGTFLLPRVVVGRYELHARLNRKPNEGAIVPLLVTSEDVTNWTIPLTAGGRMTGQVIPPANAPQVSASELDFHAMPVGDTLVFGTGFGGPVSDDWTFEWDFLLGNRIIRPFRLPRGWMLKAIMRGEDDVTDKPIAFKGAEVVNDLQIILTTETTRLSGAAMETGGKPANDYTAVVFSDDRTK